MKPNLYVVSPTHSISGVLTHVRSLVSLELSEFESRILVLPRNSSEEDGLYMSFSPRKILTTWISTLNFVKQTDEIDIIHLHGRLSLIAFAPSVILKQRKFVFTFHQFYTRNEGMLEEVKNKIEIFLARRTYKRISVSRDLKENIESNFKLDSHYIPNWLSDDKFIDEADIKVKTKKSIYLGRFSKEKNPLSITGVFSKIKDSGLTIDMYGAGPLRQDLVENVKYFKLENLVNIYPPTKNPLEVMDLYDCIIIPSHSESFGLVALEAFARGLYVLAPNIIGIRSTLQGFSYIGFNPYDQNDIANSLLSYIQLSEETKKMHKIQNLELAKQKYSDSKAKEAYGIFYGTT